MTNPKGNPAGRRKGGVDGPPTKQEETFARLYGTGMTARAAAEEAGYAKPETEGSRLLRRRVVADRVLAYMRPYVISWKKLLIKAQRVLDNHLDDSNEYAKELLEHLKAGGQIDSRTFAEFVKMLRVSAADRNTAAKMVIDAMAKINPKSLSDAAETEDAAMSRDEAVEAMLGADASPASDVAPDEPTEVTH